ncbi:MAG: DnaD domain protein [Lachnospiraceae bacterium]|nr:DnaD domain protein [Lachnospiraceae bacterium]
MADITLHRDNEHSTTEIPNRFIDEYMTNANGEFVKIYLYLLRCMNSPGCSFSISKTADKFEHTEKDIQRALKYWEKMNLLRLEYNEDKSISGIYFLDSDKVSTENSGTFLKKTDSVCPPTAASGIAAFVSAPAAPNADFISASSAPDADSASASSAGGKHTYTADDMKYFREKEEVQELLFVAESYLGRPLSPTDIQTLLYWYDKLGFSADLIVYLLEYCIAGGHSSLHYMDKVALNWKDAHIQTVEQAKRNNSTHSQLHYGVMRAFGIQGRNLIPAESAYIEKWSKGLGFGQDMINEACSRTILAIHQPNFDYADRILTNWQKQNIQTVSDIKKADAKFQSSKRMEKPAPAKTAANRFNNFPQRTYNIEQLEAELLNSAF